MTDDDELQIPRGKRNQLQHSINNLIDEFGKQTPLRALAINLGLALPGLLIFVFMSGWVSWLGAFWAAINLWGIVKWVFGL